MTVHKRCMKMEREHGGIILSRPMNEEMAGEKKFFPLLTWFFRPVFATTRCESTHSGVFLQDNYGYILLFS